MTQQQLSREIADFAFWQQTENECDRGYVRSGNSVMRRALEKLTEENNMTPYQFDSRMSQVYDKLDQITAILGTIPDEIYSKYDVYKVQGFVNDAEEAVSTICDAYTRDKA